MSDHHHVPAGAAHDPSAEQAHGHPHGHDHHQAPGGHDWGAMADHVELDGEVLASIRDAAIAAVVAAAGDRPVRRIVDIGAGVGVGTAALAAAFPSAVVHAVDAAEPLLARARQRAERLGVGARVTTSVGDLEQGLGGAGSVPDGVDLIWASMVLHHVAGPERVLRDAHGLLAPGGLVALVEFGPRVPSLPVDLGFGRPGFAARHADALAAAIADHLPPGAFSIDWPALLTDAGFEPVDTRVLRADLAPPLDPAPRRWVVDGVRRTAPMLAGRLDDDDRATLAALADPDDERFVGRRDDLRVDHARMLHLARRR